MLKQSACSDPVARAQRLAEVYEILKQQLDILDQDGWTMSAARLSSILDAMKGELP